MQRNKGASAERELFGMLRDELGLVVERNLSQTRGGGADCLSLPGIAIEVKRQETEWREAWWTQATEQAGRTRIPVVAHRRSRQPWRFVVPLTWVTGTDAFTLNLRCTVGLAEFCWLVRERLGE
jgi:Holliday junction resolvase